MKEIEEIIAASKSQGWVLEPHAKRIFSLVGLDVPRFLWTSELEKALGFAHEIGYPVVAKIVSPRILHKSDQRGVVVGIQGEAALTEAFERFRGMEAFSGVLIEEMLSGVELMVGSKTDEQFGPVILLGFGGTAVEIYHDISMRMAPLRPNDIEAMIRCLKGRRLIDGYRGSTPVPREKLIHLLETFSNLMMDLEDRIESVDLNPVMCSSTRCVIADARIILQSQGA